MEGPPVVRDDRVLATTRAVSVAIVPILTAAFVILFLFPGQTRQLWGWTIKSRMSCMFMGGGYLAGALFFFRAWRAREWHRLGPGIVATTFFAGMLGVTVFILASMLVWVELLIRESLLYLLIAMAPLALAARVWPQLKGAWHRLAHLGLALIISKFVVALALGLGAAALGGGGPKPGDFGNQAGLTLQGVAVGVTLLSLAAFSPFLVLRVIPLFEAALVAQGMSRGPMRAAQTGLQGAYYAKGLQRLAGGGQSGGGQGGEQLLVAAAGPQGQLELGLEDRQRGAQLVAGVAHEGALAFEGCLEAAEHGVEGLAQPGDLVVGDAHRQPPAEVRVADPNSSPAHRLYRPERRGGHAVAGQRGQQQGHRAADQQQHAQAVQGFLVVVERGAHHDKEPPSPGAERPRKEAGVLVGVDRAIAPLDERPFPRARQLRGAQHGPLGKPGRACDHAAAGAEDLGKALAPLAQSAAAAVRPPAIRPLHEGGNVGRARAQAAIQGGVEVLLEAQVDERAESHENDDHHAGKRQREPDADRKPA